jgi:glutamate synthase domain-containing protein 3
MMKSIDAENLHYKDLNRAIYESIISGEDRIEVRNALGHRYIGDGLRGSGVRLDIYGTAGNDLAAFMNGPAVHVHGNAQDGIGNTMNAGKIYVYGDAGDVLFYGMRGGSVFIKGSVGYRVGIHMKEYMDLIPQAVIGGSAGDFFGEYMAGGNLVILGLTSGETPVLGNYIATGMHGGRIYIRGGADPSRIDKAAKPVELDAGDMKILKPLVEEFCSSFGFDSAKILKDRFVKLIPASKRPYGKHYTPGWHTITDRKSVVPGSFEQNGYPAVRNIRER